MMIDILIVGAGHAGAQAAASLRQEGFAGSIGLVSAERELPYHKPPLSKAFLKADEPRTQPLRGEIFYSSNAISLYLGRQVERIDRAARMLEFADGSRLGYGALVLATGSTPRLPDVPGASLAGVMSLRTLSDALLIRGLLPQAGDAVVIGGGFIGLEIAATLAALGKRVTVIESAGRLLGRAVSPTVSDYVLGRMRSFGINVLLNDGVSHIEGRDGRVDAVVTANSGRIAADVVVAGIGARPDCLLASEAGLAVDDGILVDGNLATADPHIFAIGDCARFRHEASGRLVRLESVQNATDQARHVARVITGRREPFHAVPWFWSDQGDMKLQMVGLSFDADRHILAGSVEDGAFSVFHFAGDRLIAIDSINRPGDHMLGRKMIGAGYSPAEAEIMAGTGALSAGLARHLEAGQAVNGSPAVNAPRSRGVSKIAQA